MTDQTIDDAAALDPDLVCAIADGGALRLGPRLLGDVQRQCELARAVLRGGDPVYGVNTGMGALSGVRLTGPQQLAHQRNLLLARATGGPPWLPAADVRAIFAVRLRTFLSGDAGVSGQLCQRLAEFLNAGIVPAVPRAGVGCAGEIIPLAHAFGPLAGIGLVLAGGGAARPAAGPLAASGLGEFALGPKEGIALLAGVPGATALAVRRVAEAHRVGQQMTAAAALSIVAAGASRDPYGAACARGDDILAGVLGRLRMLTGDGTGAGATAAPAGGSGAGAARALQAPVSFRVAGPVLAQLLRAAGALTDAIGRALAGVTDSPAFLDGRFVGTAGFHGIDLAAHCDQLTAALAHAAEVSAARLHRLLDPRVTGLPAQLAAHSGPGYRPGHRAQARGRGGARDAPAGAGDPGRPDRDLRRPGGRAVLRLGGRRVAARRAAARRAVTACELLAGYQAVDAGRRTGPARLPRPARTGSPA